LKRARKREFAMQTTFGTTLYQRADDRVSKIIFSRLSLGIASRIAVAREIAHLSRIERCRRFISIARRYICRHVPIAVLARYFAAHAAAKRSSLTGSYPHPPSYTAIAPRARQERGSLNLTCGRMSQRSMTRASYMAL